MIRSIADVVFREEGKHEGNLSKALDFILTAFRTNSKYNVIVKYVGYKALYDRGIRTEEVLKGVRRIEAIIKSTENTENTQ